VGASKKSKLLFVRGWTAFLMTSRVFRTLNLMGDLGTDLWLETSFAQKLACVENKLWEAGSSFQS
jgi:hypothetical protein